MKNEGRKGFIPFVTAGDPCLEVTRDVVLALAAMGADAIEIGVPFSDPVADGPTIQASSQRALMNGVTINDVLDLVRDIRGSTEVPIVLFSYFNPILKRGVERLAGEAADAGVDGILITDVVDREAMAVSDILRSSGLDLIYLVAPTTTDSRLEAITASAGGFIYAVSRAGVTGTRSEMTSDAELLVRRVRPLTELPIAVGFGIATAEHMASVWQFADAAVVGSAIVDRIARAESGREVTAVETFVRSLIPAVANNITYS